MRRVRSAGWNSAAAISESADMARQKFRSGVHGRHEIFAAQMVLSLPYCSQNFAPTSPRPMLSFCIRSASKEEIRGIPAVADTMRGKGREIFVVRRTFSPFFEPDVAYRRGDSI